MNSRPFTLFRAYRWSLVFHAIAAFVLWKMSVNAVRAHVVSVQLEAARRHDGTYQRTAAETYTKRLQRMRELMDRVEAEQKKKDAAPTPETNAPKPDEKTDSKTGDPAKPEVANSKPDVNELWRESRKEFEALRKKFIEQKAKKLADLTKVDLETARKKIEAAAKSGGGAANETPKNSSEAAGQIEAMHREAQRMFNETLQQSRLQRDGQPLAGDEAREAITLGQNQQSSAETRGFDAVVDWTPLMVSRVSQGNHKLDTPEDLRRIELTKNYALRTHFNETNKSMLFTRHLGQPGAAAAAWASPDAWYIIGPFPNPARREINRSFPPEIEIDRDAVYEGKDGRPVSWKYVHSRRQNVIPPAMEDYAIYYAFTEIQCAVPMDCWLAIGSDDQSKIWINNLLIWSGAKNEKEWRPTEGFRRVHFEAGVNRLLLRLENGINGCEFSVLINLE